MHNTDTTNRQHYTNVLLTTVIPAAVVPVAAALLFHHYLNSFKWVHLPFHSLLETAGAVSALVLALFIITMRNSQELRPNYIWVATSLMGMGLLDGFHASVEPGKVFVWLHSLAVFVGGVTFALVVLPERVSKHAKVNLLPVAMAAMAVIIGIGSIAFPQLVPPMLNNGHFTLTADALNIIGGLGFLIAWLYFVKGGDTNDQLERHLLASHTLLFGTAGLLFHFSQIWDATWWLWHILRFIAYFVILGFFLKIYWKSVHLMRQNKKLLEKERALITALIEHAPALISLKDTNGNIILSNTAYENFATSINPSVSQQPSANHVAFDQKDVSTDRQVTLSKQAITLESDYGQKENSRTFISNKFPLKDPSGKVYAIGNILTDITDRKEMEKRLQLSQSIIDHTHEGIIVTDKDNLIIQTNIAYQKSTGYSERELKGKNPNFLQSDKQSDAFYQEMWSTLRSTGHWSGELWDKRKDGVITPHRLSISAIYDSNQRLNYYVGIMHDISEAKKLEEKLEQLAYYDALTKLPNRVHLKERLEQNIAACKRNNRHLAVLLLDLDNFKMINDSLGHSAGDEVLIETANRLSHQLRDSDTVSRLGGDEFVIILNEIRSEDCAITTSQKIIQTLKHTYRLQDKPIQIATSIGIAIYPNDGTDFETLLKHADLAMYSAKESGKSNFKFFSTQLHLQAKQKLELKQELENAIKHQHFCVFYQPKMDLQTQEIIGIEALVRWKHSTRGTIPPSDFMTFAEESELIIPIGKQILKQACQQTQEWSMLFNTPIHVSVNLSTRQFKNIGLVDDIKKVLATTQLPAEQLEIEITESSVMHDVDIAMQTMNQLCELGVQLSIDDFGTGYSSLNYLKQLPISTVKIDRTFVQDIQHDSNDRAIVKAIISLSDKLGLNVIAEGIEVDEQLQFLKDNGCMIGQGHFFSRPLSKGAFESYLKQALQPH